MKLKLKCLAKRQKEEAYKPENTIPSVKYGSGSVMMHQSFAAGGTGVLHNVDIMMRKHCKELNQKVEIYAKKCIFQVENISKHTMSFIKMWLKDNQVNFSTLL